MANTKAVRFVRRIDDLINQSAKTQKQIASELGYDKPNIITMFKQGSCRVPIDRVPALADSLETDRTDLVRLWLEDYEPALLQVIQSELGMTTSKNERSWIANMRKIFMEGVPPWDEMSEAAVKELTR